MAIAKKKWKKELAPCIVSSRPLDNSKLQAPCITAKPGGGYRLFYTAVGPAKPFPSCQGYILSAVSEDGVDFHKESGIRLAPQPDLTHMSRRVLAPSITMCDDGKWRMYFESRGTADQPTVICSAVSTDMINWQHEEGIRMEGFGGLGGPRFLRLPDGRDRLHCFAKKIDKCVTDKPAPGIICADTTDGLNFSINTDFGFSHPQTEFESLGITAAEVIGPESKGDNYVMIFSEWQDVPPGTEVPPHPSTDSNVDNSEDFAAASIASDISGYRSRIFTAYSRDGLVWDRGECIIDGGGYDCDGADAIHSEDMSLIEIGNGNYRMYYAACDKNGSWSIMTATTV